MTWEVRVSICGISFCAHFIYDIIAMVFLSHETFTKKEAKHERLAHDVKREIPSIGDAAAIHQAVQSLFFGYFTTHTHSHDAPPDFGLVTHKPIETELCKLLLFFLRAEISQMNGSTRRWSIAFLRV